jgi:hypothetical protein
VGSRSSIYLGSWIEEMRSFTVNSTGIATIAATPLCAQIGNVPLAADRQRSAADHPDRPRFSWFPGTGTPRGSASVNRPCPSGPRWAVAYSAGDGAAMPDELVYLGVIAKPRREHVIFPIDHDRLPPTQIQGFLGDHQVACRDAVLPSMQSTPSHFGNEKSASPTGIAAHALFYRIYRVRPASDGKWSVAK